MYGFRNGLNDKRLVDLKLILLKNGGPIIHKEFMYEMLYWMSLSYTLCPPFL